MYYTGNRHGGCNSSYMEIKNNKKPAMALVVVLVVITTLSLVIVGSIRLTTVKTDRFSYNRNSQDAIAKKEGLFICYKDKINSTESKSKYCYKFNNEEVCNLDKCIDSNSPLNKNIKDKRIYTITLISGGTGGIAPGVKVDKTNVCYQNIKIPKSAISKVTIKSLYLKHKTDNMNDIYLVANTDSKKNFTKYFMNSNNKINTNLFKTEQEQDDGQTITKYVCSSELNGILTAKCDGLNQKKAETKDYIRIVAEYEIKLTSDYNSASGTMELMLDTNSSSADELYLKQCIRSYTIYNPYAGAEGNILQKNITNVKKFNSITIGEGGKGGNAKIISEDNSKLARTSSKKTELKYNDSSKESASAITVANSLLTKVKFNNFNTEQQKISKKNENKVEGISKYVSEISQEINFGSGGGYSDFQYTPEVGYCFTNKEINDSDDKCDINYNNTSMAASTADISSNYGNDGESGVVIIEW